MGQHYLPCKVQHLWLRLDAVYLKHKLSCHHTEWLGHPCPWHILRHACPPACAIPAHICTASMGLSVCLRLSTPSTVIQRQSRYLMLSHAGLLLTLLSGHRLLFVHLAFLTSSKCR